MAGLMKTKSGYYIARTHPPRGSHPCEIKTPLMTKDYKTALIRKLDVEEKADEIKAGIKFSFTWMGTKPEVKIAHFTLKDARDKYVSARKADRLAESTISIIENALDHLQRVLRPSFPIETIKIDHIDAFKRSCHNDKKKYALTTVNIRLRNIKTFLIWLHDRNHIAQVPKIKMLPVSKEIRYLSNDQFEAICKKVSPFLSRVFYFYRETGCRLSEPFFGVIDGEYLKISAEHAKGKRSRSIRLNEELMCTLLELRSKTHLPNKNSKKSNPNFRIIRNTHEIKYYSKAFKQAAIDCGFDQIRFHDTRHTAALRAYLTSHDLYAVARKLGHSSVELTQRVYANFEDDRLEQDFPDLVTKRKKAPIQTLQPKLALSS
jgi:integrase